MAIMSKLSQFVRSLTSDKGNTDSAPGVRVPPTDEGPVPMPEREPQVGFEPEREPERDER